MKAELFAYLNADAPLTVLVGARIFPQIAPPSASFPRVTITRIVNGHERHMLASSGLSRATYQIDSWALNSPSVEAVAEALRNALDGFIGKLMGGIDIRSIFLVDENDNIEEPTDGSDNSIYRISQDYTINHRESIPTP